MWQKEMSFLAQQSISSSLKEKQQISDLKARGLYFYEVYQLDYWEKKVRCMLEVVGI